MTVSVEFIKDYNPDSGGFARKAGYQTVMDANKADDLANSGYIKKLNIDLQKIAADELNNLRAMKERKMVQTADPPTVGIFVRIWRWLWGYDPRRARA